MSTINTSLSVAGPNAGRQILSVFWEGTANTLNPITTQIGVFSQACCAVPVAAPNQVPQDRRCPLKVSFDGCGVTNGSFWGGLFARGLEEQCDLVVAIVRKMLQNHKSQSSSTNTTTNNNQPEFVHVVGVGLSRGGVACMKLAQKLAKAFPANNTNTGFQEVTASMLLFDPVPGNALSTGFPYTACWSGDLSGCHNLRRVLALYPYEALPDIAMHAPSLCYYNRRTTLVQEDVTLGCHQGALFPATPRPQNPYHVASNLSMRRILDFLTYEGVQCQFARVFYVPSPQECIKYMEKDIQRHGATETLRRKAHDFTGQQRQILRNKCIAKTDDDDSQQQQYHQYLNFHHEQLVKALRKGTSTATRAAVFGVADDDNENSSSEDDDHEYSPYPKYQLEMDDGYITCTMQLTNSFRQQATACTDTSKRRRQRQQKEEQGDNPKARLIRV
ncbi:expressed unknown protein [Seminavis robusta]|uniref:Uncharacterized protein n=1 Tax=Seminavis robusta TaxID=568900 RepID=A0A9N8E1T8_9STRA|nr:expressed unknown protein [Seminavis robusta]|eukprot:Sro566_g167780.1 n/a (445) ;mRNA; r:15591-16925